MPDASLSRSPARAGTHRHAHSAEGAKARARAGPALAVSRREPGTLPELRRERCIAPLLFRKKWWFQNMMFANSPCFSMSPRLRSIGDVFAVTSAASALTTLDQSTFDAVFPVLNKVLTNILTNPKEERYKKLRTSNAKVAQLLAVGGVLDLLHAAGFITAQEGDASVIILPDDALLEGVQQATSLLQVQAAERQRQLGGEDATPRAYPQQTHDVSNAAVASSRASSSAPATPPPPPPDLESLGGLRVHRRSPSASPPPPPPPPPVAAPHMSRPPLVERQPTASSGGLEDEPAVEDEDAMLAAAIAASLEDSPSALQPCSPAAPPPPPLGTSKSVPAPDRNLAASARELETWRAQQAAGLSGPVLGAELSDGRALQPGVRVMDLEKFNAMGTLLGWKLHGWRRGNTAGGLSSDGVARVFYDEKQYRTNPYNISLAQLVFVEGDASDPPCAPPFTYPLHRPW